MACLFASVALLWAAWPRMTGAMGRATLPSVMSRPGWASTSSPKSSSRVPWPRSPRSPQVPHERLV